MQSKKIQIDKAFLNRVLDFYAMELMNKFRFEQLTQATKYRLEDELKNIQLVKQSVEPLNTFWFIDVKVIYGENAIDVDITDPDQIQII